MPTKRKTKAITLTLGKDLIDILETEAKRRHSSKSQVLREMVSDAYSASGQTGGENGRPLPATPVNGDRVTYTVPTSRIQRKTHE